jgi:hypothetical protein
MSRPDEAATLLRQGFDPVAIQHRMRITLPSVLGYLDRKVGSGELRRSDIYFSMPAKIRKDPPTADYRTILHRYKNGAAAYGDMYEDVRAIELGLHAKIRDLLVEALGPAENEWWRQGVPEKVRAKCAERRELDTDAYVEPYGYTDLLDLSKILDFSWKHFCDTLPKRLRSNKGQFLAGFRRLNSIRNRVMHPVRGAPPDESDFEFVRDLKDQVTEWLAAIPTTLRQETG